MKRFNLSLRWAVVGLVSAASVTIIAPTPTEACGNEYVKMYLLPVATRRVERVESLIAEGNSRAAYRVAAEVADAVDQARAVDRPNEFLSAEAWAVNENVDGYSDWAEVAPETAHPDREGSIERRAKMLRAILIVRLDGQIARNGRAARRVHASVRSVHLIRARGDLESLVADHPDDPRLSAYLAEAIALIDPTEAPQSHATLRDLATRDLIGDPLTWVALASLEPDSDAREAALEHCRTIVSRRADRVCPLPEA